MTTVLTSERRNALGSLITKWFSDQDDDGRTLDTFDYCDSNTIDMLIDEAIAPAMADAVQCALVEQAKRGQADLLEALRELRGEIVYNDEGNMLPSEFDVMLKRADAAIAKATSAV